MIISNPILPPKYGFVEIEVNGERKYKNIITNEIEEENQNYIPRLEKINDSKEKLTAFLSNNPILWKDGKYYSVTQEKQSLLTSNIATYQIEIQTNPSAVITWNSTGEECVEWNINDLCALAVAIKDYVKPMVTYQQKKEIEINQASTIEELNQIEIDYSSVKVQPVWNEE